MLLLLLALSGCSSPSGSSTAQVPAAHLPPQASPSHVQITDPDSVTDIRSSSFPDYDKYVLGRIQIRWWNLVDLPTPLKTKHGKVVITWRLHSDGDVSRVILVEQSVGELHADLCKRAILESAPFEPWPEGMRRKLGRDFRDIKLTFHYWGPKPVPEPGAAGLPADPRSAP